MREMTCMSERIELEVAPGLSLVHDPRERQGKTRDMDKGLFLCLKGRLCAGESTGIGLPVLKAGGRTFFPTLAGMEPGGGSVTKSFSMDRVLVWHMGKRMAPPWVPGALERVVDVYARMPVFQHGLLKLRDLIFSLCRVESSMVRVDPEAWCSVRYEPVTNGVRVQVGATGLGSKAVLIMANEVDGRAFTRLRSKGRVLDGNAVPAWKRAPMDAVFESPLLGLSLGLRRQEDEPPVVFEAFCGREVGLLLDWAGISLACRKPVFAYQAVVSFLKEKS